MSSQGEQQGAETSIKEDSLDPWQTYFSKQFNDLFHRVAKIKNYKVQAEFFETLTPFQQKGRRVPITLQDSVDKEISNILQQGHIEKLEECSDKYFVSPISLIRSALGFTKEHFSKGKLESPKTTNNKRVCIISNRKQSLEGERTCDGNWTNDRAMNCISGRSTTFNENLIGTFIGIHFSHSYSHINFNNSKPNLNMKNIIISVNNLMTFFIGSLKLRITRYKRNFSKRYHQFNKKDVEYR